MDRLYVVVPCYNEEAVLPETSRRLAICRDCDQLRSGLCALCGCYVELRAAKGRMGCPALPPRWEPWQDK